MSEKFKLAFIGAGSFRFSIGFFRNIVNAIELFPLDVVLCDIDANSLDIMSRILKRMIEKAAKLKNYDPKQITISTTTDRVEALTNADFVYKSIAVGIQKSDWFDNYLPLKFGIMQNTGDTLGPGGLFRGLRTNHVAASIALDMKKLCPKAPLLNYTNPQGSIVMAARTAAPDIQYIGLCHELFGGMGTMRKFANQFMGTNITDWREMDYEYAGINHFAWFTKMGYKGQDMYPLLKQKAHELVLKKYDRSFNFFLLEKHGYFPYPGSRHVAEFMTDYYNYFNYSTQSPYWSFPTFRSVWGLDLNRQLRYHKFRHMASGKIDVPAPAAEGEKAMEMTMDWKEDSPNVHVVNIPNTHPNYAKIVPELPDDCIVEIPGVFKNHIITPVKSVHLPANIADLVRPHAEQQRFTVNAALGNSMDLVVKAMQHDPMANWIEDVDKLEYLAKLMVFYEQEWLPPQWKEWIPTEAELNQSKWWIPRKDLSKFMFNYRKIRFPPNPELKQKAYFWK